MTVDTALDRCGCFEQPADASELFNRPGLSSVAYRIGTHATFFNRMLAALPSQTVGAGALATRPLEALTSRATDDPGIGIIDAWSVVCDVMTFYQERIANEGFHRTATERRSILELARTIGYELNPGVAASAFLAFTVEDAESAPTSAVIAERVKVLSIPGQDERPQTFETVEEIEARVEWNCLRPLLTAPQGLERGADHVYLAGTDTQLQPGDVLLFVGDARATSPGSERWDVRVIDTVDVQADERNQTLVTWREGLGHDSPTIDPEDNPVVYVFRGRASLFGHNAPDWKAMPLSVKRAYDATYPRPPQDNPDKLIQGHTQWPGFELPSGDKAIVHLDGIHPKVAPDTWIAFTRPGYSELYKVVTSSPSARSDFTISSKTTRLELDAHEHLSWFGLRETLVYTESTPLPLGEEPILDEVAGDRIELDEIVGGFRRGHTIIVTGKKPGASKEEDALAEVAFIDRTDDSSGHTTLHLTGPLLNRYDRTTVQILANVARSTHGETVTEVLGNGDGTQANQRFTIRKPPLTYVSAQTPTGARSELEVRVDGVLWDEVPSLYGLGPSSRNYVVRIDDDANATLIFGDGTSGARLPTGLENVGSTYRSGIGPDGAVDAGSLTLLQTRPFGVKSVTNPIRASGAAAPEALDEARTNAPLTVLTLDRIVSLQDFEDFARAFAGIGKARAVTLWDGKSRFVHLTVAAADGTELEPGGELETNLVAAIDLARDAVPDVVVQTSRKTTFDVAAPVLVDDSYDFDSVLGAVHTAIEDEFSFDRRSFGQPVTRAELMTAIQDVEGVVATTVDAFRYTGSSSDVAEIMIAESAHVIDPPVGLESAAPRTVAAQLLVVNPAGVSLSRMGP